MSIIDNLITSYHDAMPTFSNENFKFEFVYEIINTEKTCPVRDKYLICPGYFLPIVNTDFRSSFSLSAHCFSPTSGGT